MGNRVSRVVGCLVPRDEHDDDDVVGVLFSEPLDEGLGHSFCYVRPALDSPSSSPTHHNSSDLSFSDRIGIDPDALNSGPLGQDHGEGSQSRPKSLSETSFKAISGAAVSANSATPRSILTQEQFTSISNIPCERPSAFESTSSFSALPLQPIPKGISNSGPISGSLSGSVSAPLERGFMSGPLERGFMSGPLERGFMSGPLERASMSGSLEGAAGTTDRRKLSSLLVFSFPYSGYTRGRKSLARFMRNFSKPVRRAFSRRVTRPNRSMPMGVAKIQPREMKNGARALEDWHSDTGNECSEFAARNGHNLQWAQGKAGEDRIHVVLSEEHGWLFVGIYDGFSGPDAPDYLMCNLYPAIYKELKGLLWGRNQGFGFSDDCKTLNSIENTGDVKQLCHWSTARRDGGAEILDSKVEELSEGRCDSEKDNAVTMQGELHADGSCHRTLAAAGPEGSSRMLNIDTIGRSEGATEQVEVSSAFGSCGHVCTEQIFLQSLRQPGQTYAEECNNSALSAKWNYGDSEAVWGTEQDGKLFEAPLCLDEERDMAARTDQCRGNGLESKGELQLLEHTHNNHNAIDCSQSKPNARNLSTRRLGGDGETADAAKKTDDRGTQNSETEKVSKRGLVDHSAVLRALACALEVTEVSYLEMAEDNPELALVGSCVLVMLMKGEDVYIMNVGDSRAILAQHRKTGTHSRGQLCGQSNGSKVEDQDPIGARDSMLKIELERIIEETPQDLEAVEASYDVAQMAPPAISQTLCAFQLSSDHSTSIEEEIRKLKEAHPDDPASLSNDRVKGRLKVTRAFGAGFLKQAKWNNALLEVFRVDYIGGIPYITCTPSLYHHRLGPQDRFLVLSSDGLYEYLTNEEVVSHVEWFMEKYPDGDPAQYLIEELLFRAAKRAGMDFHELLDIPHGDRRKYHDDISVMVISLEGRIWRSSG